MSHAAPRVGIIICSTRRPRACPQITNFVLQTITTTSLNLYFPTPTLHLIDLAEWDLPLFDESDIPSQIHDPNAYDHEHTRAWSHEVSSYDTFIFVTPQYNWGYPAALKNAIDYLYNEWKGKPAMIVSYGGHGGGKCASQLRQVLLGVGMVPADKNVELIFPGKEFLVRAARGKELELDGSTEGRVWSAERKQIVDAFDQLMDSSHVTKRGQVCNELAKDTLREKYGKGDSVNEAPQEGDTSET